MLKNLIILATLFCLPAKHCWSGDPITIDGLFDDWVPVPDRSDIPHRFQLFPAYPNPFNPTTNIRYSLPVKTHVSLKVYDMLGHQIKVMVNEIKTPGSYIVGFDATGLASGVYTFRLEATGFSKVQKFILLK